MPEEKFWVISFAMESIQLWETELKYIYLRITKAIAWLLQKDLSKKLNFKSTSLSKTLEHLQR